MDLTDEQKAIIYTLRDKTGCGGFRCRKALELHEWDIDKAIEWIRATPMLKGF